MTKSKPLVDLPGFDFEGQVLTDTGSGMLEGIRVMHSRELTIWTTPAMQSFQQQIDALMPGHVNRVDCRKCGQADMVALITSYSDQNPGQLMVYRAGAAEPWTRLGPLRPEAPTDQGASVQFKRIRARDGLDLPVWITRPAGASGPLPTVMLVHGGPWLRGWRWEWNPMAQFLASRGYLVIAPEIRGSTGYGRAHYVAGFKQFGQAMQDDGADALRWAQAEGLASDRACIAGASYGGYSTLMGLIKDADLYRCGVASLAPADLNLYLEGSWWVDDDIQETDRKANLPRVVGDVKKDADMLDANSPVKQAARLKAPLLLAYGEQDLRVPLAHGERMRSALRWEGRPPTWVTYANEAHGFVDLKNQVDFARKVETFLAKHLAPQ
jgi:dipeptidyl aminopeptidase/acylaminoacyl peptidase